MEDLNVSTRDKIIKVSVDLFADQGYIETSLREIAKVVGIKASSIYNHFSSKEAILMELFNMYKRNTLKNTPRDNSSRLKSDEVTVENLYHRLFFVFAPEDAEMYIKILKIMLKEHAKNDVIKAYMQEEIIINSYEYIKSELDAIIETGGIKPIDTVAAASMLYSCTLSYTTMMFLDLYYMDRNSPEHSSMVYLLYYILQKICDGTF